MTGAIFGEENGGDTTKKTHACHISIKRKEVHFSEVSGQILMVWASKKVNFNREKCLVFFLRSKDLK